MGKYVVITWPYSQDLMDKPGFEENSYLVNDEKGMRDFGGSAYFVDEDWLDSLEECEGYGLVDDIVTQCLHSLDDDEEYVFETPVELSENRIARCFWVDDGNEDVRVEIWQTKPTYAWRENAFLSSMKPEDAVKVAHAIYLFLE